MSETPANGGYVTWREFVDERRDRRDVDEKLDRDKADAKDVARLAEEFKSLRLTLQWFMGIVATFIVALAVVVIQLGSH